MSSRHFKIHMHGGRTQTVTNELGPWIQPNGALTFFTEEDGRLRDCDVFPYGSWFHWEELK